jgi:hypothetical protein
MPLNTGGDVTGAPASLRRYVALVDEGEGFPAKGTTRREFVSRAGGLGLGVLIASALPIAERMAGPSAAFAAEPNLLDGTLQAYYDTIIPGRTIAATQSGAGIHPNAILGVDPEPGAVEADALALGQDARLGFSLLAPALLGEIEVRAVTQGGLFLDLDWAGREAVVKQGLGFSNPTRQVWEAGAAVAFTAFCAAATVPGATNRTAVGYRVMGHPGAAPHGYEDFSYGVKLNRGLTKNGSLP